MREILFRGKSNYGNVGEWEYGLVAQPHVTENGIVTSYYFTKLSENGYSSQRTVSANTIGQYTGLTDKNGQKIFEGDICQIKGTPHIDETPFVIEWNNEYCGWFWRDLSFGSPTDGMTPEIANMAKVIGNIHDNPELMEGATSDA